MRTIKHTMVIMMILVLSSSCTQNGPKQMVAKLNEITSFVAVGDCSKAEKKYQEFISAGYAPDSIMEKSLGDCFMRKEAYDEALKWYLQSASHGFASAQNSLGQMYQYGIGVNRDIAEAIKWYHKAADQNNAAALFNLGYIYDFDALEHPNDGVAQDVEEAMKWYLRSAQLGLKEAQANLAYLYEMKEQYSEAFEWYGKAADQGSALAQNQLGNFYYSGIVVQKDLDKAIEWWEKAARQGYEPAQNNLKQLK